MYPVIYSGGKSYFSRDAGRKVVTYSWQCTKALTINSDVTSILHSNVPLLNTVESNEIEKQFLVLIASKHSNGAMASTWARQHHLDKLNAFQFQHFGGGACSVYLSMEHVFPYYTSQLQPQLQDCAHAVRGSLMPIFTVLHTTLDYYRSDETPTG